jgi:hypothetical protein
MKVDGESMLRPQYMAFTLEIVSPSDQSSDLFVRSLCQTELDLNAPRGRSHHLANLLEERRIVQAGLIRAKDHDFDNGECGVHQGPRIVSRDSQRGKKN